MKNNNFYIRVGIESYFDRFKEFSNFVNSQGALVSAHDFIVRATNNGKDLKTYYNSEAIRKTIDLYLSKINEHLAKAKPVKKISASRKTPVTRGETKAPVPTHVEPTPKVKRSRKAGNNGSEEQPIQVERIPEELRFIRRFVNLNGKTKTKDELLRFINSLQKSIVEKRIRKTSPHAEHIRYIQARLIATYNDMKAKILIKIQPDTYETLQQVAGGEKVLASIGFIKRYIGLNGKTGVKDKAKQLLEQINRAITKGSIPDGDPYSIEMYEIKKNLHAFITGKGGKTLEIERATLNGLNELLGGVSKNKNLYDTAEKRLKAIRKKRNIITFKEQFYPRGTSEQGYKQIMVMGVKKDRSGAIKILGQSYDSNWYNSVDELINAVDWEWMEQAHGLDGLGCASCPPKKQKPTIMSSVDFADLEFDTIGLRGKWYHLIGDPSPNFKGMISGKPKLGKSTLCIEFAGYLARHHGKVLYVAKEEGLDYTLQQKLTSKDVVHPNLDVASVLPDNLAPYNFIFIDSVTRMNLKPEDLDKLEKSYPDKAFVYVFQTTKDGKFRGANAFQHNVDVVIDVPEKGKAVQMGRFNQGGEMEIFEEEISVAA